MIEFKEGKVSSVVISTIFGHAGRGMFPYVFYPSYQKLIRLIKETQIASLAKSSTMFKRQGDYIWWNFLTWKYVQKLPNKGLLNAYGLTNNGVKVNADGIAVSCKMGFKVIPNFYPEFAKGTDIAIKETIEAIEIYAKVLGSYFWITELSFSCPNSEEDIKENMGQAVQCVRAVKKLFPFLRIIAKLSIVHPFEFAREFEQAGADVIHAVNTLPYNMLYPNKQSPLHKVGGGGVSGGPTHKMAFNYNSTLRKIVKLPLIMGCGIMNLKDAEKYFDIGADAISICTLASYDSEGAGKIIKKYNT
ncbi:MAG: hypothetical protein U9R14_01475 [Patescibacteria group bacterium]|nr:hypothetical protein [Patescibacteria group bacterium]